MNKPVTKAEIDAQAQRLPSSQATQIEQSRAIAEVQARVLVAQRSPRNESAALEMALTSCRQYEVAKGAFYKFPRGGETVSGESISLAVELARCWGNIDYGIMELARHDGATEMLAFAWDVQANTISRQTFIVPHRRDTRTGPKALTDMRDIYENNANNGARRLRECIFRVLPPYLKEAAKNACYSTLEKGEGEQPIQVRVADAIKAFKDLGIGIDRLEAKFGSSAQWTAMDVAQLEVSYRSIKRREVSADEEFPRNDTADFNEEAKRLAADKLPDTNTNLQDSSPSDAPLSPEDGTAPVNAPSGDNAVQKDEAADQRQEKPLWLDLVHRAEATSDEAELADIRKTYDANEAELPVDRREEILDAMNAAQDRIGLAKNEGN